MLIIDFIYAISYFSADDASGRFTNGFFWGNSYFVGSATECAYIGHDYTRSIFDQTQWNSTFSSLNTQDGNSLGGSKIIINSGPSGSNNLPVTIPDTPPYKLGFFMMTVSINSSILTPIVSNTLIIHYYIFSGILLNLFIYLLINLYIYFPRLDPFILVSACRFLVQQMMFMSLEN